MKELGPRLSPLTGALIQQVEKNHSGVRRAAFRAVRELVGAERQRVIGCYIAMVEQHDPLGLSGIDDLKVVGRQVGDRISVTIHGNHVQINQPGSRWSRWRVLRRKHKDERNGDGEYHRPPFSLTDLLLPRPMRLARVAILHPIVQMLIGGGAQRHIVQAGQPQRFPQIFIEFV